MENIIISRQRKKPHIILPPVHIDNLTTLDFHGPIAIDFETKGLDILDPNNQIVGCGISDGSSGRYILTPHKEDISKLLDFLSTKQLIVFNGTFELAWFGLNKLDNIKLAMDCQLVYRYLANEGYTGQSHTLKKAMVDVLGWDEPNNIELLKWLKENKLPKSEMWKAPIDILGPYCALDAIATYHLYEYFTEVLQHFQELNDFIKNEANTLLFEVVRQYLHGVKINVEKLVNYKQILEARRDAALQTFYNHEAIYPHILSYKEQKELELERSEPEKYTKSGKVAARWVSWKHKTPKEFNPNSPKQLQWLLYDRAGLDPPNESRSTDEESLICLGDPGQLLVKYKKVCKLLQFVKALLELQKGGIMHFSMKMAGTCTGRLSGGI